MCIIVDTNVATKVFSAQPPEDFAPVFEWLHAPDKDGCVVYGGRLGEEILKLDNPRRYLRELLRAGRARVFPEPALVAEENRVRLSGQCQSNDHHVIALARVSGARTLCSHDQDLHADFKNRDLISRPRGSVYQDRRHVRLLRHTSACRTGRGRGR